MSALRFDLGPLDPDWQADPRDLGTLDTLPWHFDIDHANADASAPPRVVWTSDDGATVTRADDEDAAP